MSSQLADERKRVGGSREMCSEEGGGACGGVSTGALCWQLAVQGLYYLDLGRIGQRQELCEMLGEAWSWEKFGELYSSVGRQMWRGNL